MSNSPLVNYTQISPNKNSPRNHVIDTITIHHMAGNCDIETCGRLFADPKRGGSSNYGVGTDGRIALYVDETDRSWCSSSSANDNRAVTIEVANDGRADTNWHVSDKAMQSLIKLVADICQRNHIKTLKWVNDKSLVGDITKQNMTVHRWFAATSCPGDYLMSKMGYIADEVNKLLGYGSISTEPSLDKMGYYRIRTSWADSSSQKGAYLDINKAIKACPVGFSVFNEAGEAVYTNNPSTSRTDTSNSGSSSANTGGKTNDLYRVRRSWDDPKSQIGAYENLTLAKKACKSGYKVYNSLGEVLYSSDEKLIYRIRTSWVDAKSQIGAYNNLDKAKRACPKGYTIFDNWGGVVYSNPE